MPIDKSRVGLGFRNALGTYDAHATVQADMARHLASMVEKRGGATQRRLFEIGCGTGLLTEALCAGHTPEALFLNDLVPDCIETLQARLPITRTATFLMGDIERLHPLPQSLDWIVSNACLQWMVDLPALLHRLHESLKPGGCLLFSTFGPDNLKEVLELAGPGLAYRTLASLHAVVGDCFEVLQASEARVTLTFPTPGDVLRHLKATGVNGLGGDRLNRAALHRFLQDYETRFATPEGAVSLTYHPQYCLARKAGESS